MELRQLLTGDPKRRSTLYLALGVISLAKALALRNDSTRFKRELLDAGLFLGLGIALRRYATLKAEKRSQLEGQLPAFLQPSDQQSTAAADADSGLTARAKAVISN